MNFGYKHNVKSGLVATLLALTLNAGTQAATMTSTSEYFSATQYSPIQVRLSPSVGSYPLRGLPSALMVGAQVGFSYRSTRSQEWGVEVGYLTGSLDSALSDFGMKLPAGMSVRLNVIPILFTSLHRFGDGPIHPYIGVAAGIGLLTMEGSVSSGGGEEGSSASGGASATSLALLAYARPGIEWNITPRLAAYVEARAGVATSGLIFSPQAGIALGL
jgi:hypothetical protein